MWRESEGRVVPPLRSFNHALPFCKELRPPDLDDATRFCYSPNQLAAWIYSDTRVKAKTIRYERALRTTRSGRARLVLLYCCGIIVHIVICQRIKRTRMYRVGNRARDKATVPASRVWRDAARRGQKPTLQPFPEM